MSLLLLLSGLVLKGAAESPWGLPFLADDPVSMAKVVMADLAQRKVENKSWPRGTHSLRYHYLDLSEPGPSLPRFLAVGYVDDQPFIRYDSHVDKAEPQAPWIMSKNVTYWENETKKQRKWAEIHQVETWIEMGYHNHSTGIHSTQRMFGCEIQEDGHSNSFWQFGYDGQDHLSLDMETLNWVTANPMALWTKRWWQTERCYAEYNKAYLEGPCLAYLHRYLELGGQRFTRREPPTVRVTKHSAQDGGTTLRCWALGFYPRDISLSWWLGEKKLNSKLEYVETRPSGDGTYQTWMAVWVPAGNETQYTCHVQHSSLNHTLTVSWEMPSHPGLTAIVLSLILILLVIGGAVSLIKCLQARNKEPYEQAPGDCGMDQLGRGNPRCSQHSRDALEFRIGVEHALPPLLPRPSRTQRPGLACPGYNDELCRISKQPRPGQMGTNDKGRQEGPALGWYFLPPLTSWKMFTDQCGIKSIIKDIGSLTTVSL